MSDARQPLLDGDHGTHPSSGIERSNELTSATAPSGDAQDNSHAEVRSQGRARMEHGAMARTQIADPCMITAGSTEGNCVE